jgi:hypothetical protein
VSTEIWLLFAVTLLRQAFDVATALADAGHAAAAPAAMSPHAISARRLLLTTCI